MTIFGCYVIAMLPLLAAGLLWFFCKRIVWFEALILAASGFAISTIYYLCVSYGAYDDTETWSGTVTSSIHYSRWLEYYEYAVYRTEYYTVTVADYSTDSKGRSHRSGSHTETRSRQVFDHWQPTQQWHNDSWSASDTLVGSYGIDQGRFEDIHKKFGGLNPVPGTRTVFSDHNSRMLAGDPNDYEAVNVNSFVYPVTTTKTWQNRVKACPSVFSYKPVPPDIKVFEYPENSDHFSSDRLLGPVGINHEKWDQLNAVVGPVKKVNLIICAFGTDASPDMGQFQEAKWVGGKKNDIVITYGGGDNDAKPSWVHVFGWTESDLAKLNIQSIIMKDGVNDAILPLIRKEIVDNYNIKDWHKFDYLRAEIPFSHYIWLLLITIVIGGGWVIYALCNDIEKDDAEDNLSFDGLRGKPESKRHILNQPLPLPYSFRKTRRLIKPTGYEE